MRKTALPTTEMAIRAAVKGRLARRHANDAEAFVVEELPIGRGDARVDVALINGKIEGVEIKSSRDTLGRLPRQMEAYGEAIDRMTLVAASKHVEAAMELLPSWWSIVEAVPGPRGGMALRRKRQGRLNPDVTSEGYLRLLEREELIGLLSMHDLDRGWRSTPWEILAERVLRSIRPPAIAEGVRWQLKIRVLIEARICRTAFGNSAVGGGLRSNRFPPKVTEGTPVGSGAG